MVTTSVCTTAPSQTESTASARVSLTLFQEKIAPNSDKNRRRQRAPQRSGNNNSGERRRKDGERIHSEQQPTGPSTASNIGRSAATDTSNPIYEVSLPMDQTQDKNSKYLETESRTSPNTSNIKQPATNDTSNPIYGVPLPMDEIQDGSSRHLEKRPKASPSESNIEQSATNDTLNPIYGVPFPMDQIQGMTFPSLSGDGGTPCRSCGDSANDVMLSPPPPEVEGKEARGGHQYFVLEQESPPSRQPRQNTEAPHGKETIALEGFAPRDGHGTKKAGEDPETTRDDMQSRGLQGNQSDAHSLPKGPYYFTLEPPFGNQDDETSETTSQGESSDTEGYNHVKRQRAHEAQSPNYSHLTPQSEYDHINRFGHMHSTYGDMSQFHGYSMYSHLKSHDEK
ncbi:uncharacterized protein LOC110989914 isoform X2 [Acanthaster planci]|nr:uncharacterized protein LOC110989914 isoform X2 [Acanthaster planci]